MHELDRKGFKKEAKDKEEFSEDYNTSQGSAMLSRFDDTVVMDEDIILTSRRSKQRDVLVKQLSKCADMNNRGFNFAKSPYFNRYLTTLNAASYGMSATMGEKSGLGTL